MNSFTPAQVKAIQTWAEQRDGLIREIGIYSSQLDELKKSVKEHGLALTDFHKSTAEAEGRIAMSKALEERHAGSLSIEVAELMARKSRLEGACEVMETKLVDAEEKYSLMTEVIQQLEAVHMTMKDQAAIVNSVVGEIIQTSQLHTSEMKTIMSDVKAISVDVIEKGNANVAQTNIILEKLPRYIFELQKPIPVRRTYSPERGTHIPASKLTP